MGRELAHPDGQALGLAAPELAPGARATRVRLGARTLLHVAVTLVLLLSVAVFVFLAILPRTGAYRTLTVLSGSMRPTFGPGDLVIARPVAQQDVRVGDILVYQIPVGDHHVESHRIVKIIQRYPRLVVKTKGDANSAPDPWTAVLHGQKLWIVRGVVPYVGNAIIWLRDPLVHKVATFLVPLVFALLVILRIWSGSEREGLTSDTDGVDGA
jgi:signal peptidase